MSAADLCLALALSALLSVVVAAAQYMRAEKAEAERDALRAKVAAVEALHWDVEGKCAHCRDCYHDDYLPWPCPTAAALRETHNVTPRAEQ